MKRAALTIAAFATFATVVVHAPAIADTTKSADVAMTNFHEEQAINLAFVIRQHDIEEELRRELAFYQPIPEDKIGSISDVAVLRAQLVSAQRAAHIATETVAAALSPATVQNTFFTTQMTSALAVAATTPELQSPFVQSMGGTRVLAVWDNTKFGLSPASPEAITTFCNVMQYITAGFGTTGPQFITTTGATVGQKNTLSIVGFGLGIIPVAFNCTKDKSTTNNAGGKQQPPVDGS